MLYYSTKHQSPKVSLKEAISHSEAPDGGLYMPERIPPLPKAFFRNIPEMTLGEISYVVANTFFGDDIPSAELKRIVDETSNFPIPLVEIEPGIYALELFHGPTMTIKDIGARFLARMTRYLRMHEKEPLNVIAATNGNTGSAVANGICGVEDINIYVLYPRTVTRTQVAHFTSLGGNVHAIKVDGTIDDCRRILAAAMADPEMNEKLMLTTATSVNIGRLLPKVAVFFYGYSRLLAQKENVGDVWVSVPSGNLGNLLAGYIAIKMGLPLRKLIAACNANGAFHKYLSDGALPEKRQTISTCAYAMDTMEPANIDRIMDLCQGNLSTLRQNVASGMVADDEIRHTINDVYARTGYMLDPHSAVGYRCLRDKLPQGAAGIVLATAHPAKSIDIMTDITGRAVELPLPLTRFMNDRHREATIPPTYPAFKKILKQ